MSVINSQILLFSLFSTGQVDQLARLPHAVVGSVKAKLNIGEPLEDDLLKARLWDYLGLTRIYTKRKGEKDYCVASWTGSSMNC